MPGQAAEDTPGFIAPMLAMSAAGLPPDAAEFVAEVKMGRSGRLYRRGGRAVRAWSRTGRDITAAYPELGALAAVAGRRRLVLDEEIVALSGARPDFTLLQRRMRSGRPVGFRNSALGPDLGFYAARSYSLMRPPRTGRRLIRSWERSAT
jgi:bifunctional non-homologous end joining protein LigD